MLTTLSEIRFLNNKDLPQMFEAFSHAFSDYEIPFKISLAEFTKKFVDKLSIDFGLSPAIFHQGKITAFIFTSINYYDGRLTAYNGGTGVLPEYRGRRYVQQLYHHLMPRLQNRMVSHCVLEVLTRNERAIKVYESCGFGKSRYYHCFKLLGRKRFKNYHYPWNIRISTKPDWKTYTRYFDFLPSFLDTPAMIDQNLKNEKIIEAIIHGEVVGYAIYQKAQGRISHIGVSPNWRGKGIGSSLIDYIYEDATNKDLTMININKEAAGVKDFLTRMGFENQFDQWEMVKSVDK